MELARFSAKLRIQDGAECGNRVNGLKYLDIVWWMLETSVCTKLLIVIKDKSNININIILFINFKTSFGFCPVHLWN